MNIFEQIYVYSVALGIIMNLRSTASATPKRFKTQTDIRMEPLESIVYSGDNVSFTCYFPLNVTFEWDYRNAIKPHAIITSGISIPNATNNNELYWSKLHLISVKRFMSGEVTCSIQGTTKSAIAFLIVNGVKIGGSCRSNEDCITDKAICHNGECACPKKDVLIRLTESGYEVCRKMSYNLYDTCEFSEECFHLVDSKSVCSMNGQCICNSWSVDVNGKCVSKGEVTFNKSQELYRVGLVAITCLIIIIIATSLWITLRKSCRQRNGNLQSRYLTHNDDSTQRNSVIMEISDDKPPTYDVALETLDTVNSPPNFKEALTSSMTATKLLRQVSAPAGQLLPHTTTSFSLNFNPSVKTNNDLESSNTKG